MRISAVMCTRDRGASVLPALRSVLEQRTDGFEVILIDQSASGATQTAIEGAGLGSDARLSYQRSVVTGLSRGRNAGVAAAQAEVIAFTDDDCVVPSDWLAGLSAAIEAAAAGVVFAPLLRADDAPKGWVPEFRPDRLGAIQRRSGVIRQIGLGANFAITRHAFDALGGFDEMLGAGSAFPASEDTDFGYRALLHGIEVIVCAEPAVLHYGARAGAAASEAGRAYLRGFAAMATKHARCGDTLMARALASEVARWSLSGTRHLLHGARPTGYRAAAAVVGASLKSLRVPVDHDRRMYRAAPNRRS